MFVFATTEPHKVPRTIISRCQAFDFRRISSQNIAAHLKKVAASLDVDLSAEALSLIANRANGGMRDALVMLEQVTSYGGTTIGADTVLDMLGLAERAVHEAFLTAIETGDQASVMDIIDQLVDRGKDLEIFLEDLLTLLRDRLKQPSARAGKDIQIAKQILDLKADLFRSLDRRIRLEVGVLALVESLAASPSGATAPTMKPSVKATVKPSTTAPSKKVEARTPPKSQDTAQTQAAAVHPAVKQGGPQTAMPSASVNSLSEESKQQWEAMLEEIQHDRIAIAAFLIEGSPSVAGDRLVVSFHPEHSFHKASLEMRDNLQYLAGVVRRHFGAAMRVEIRTDESVARKPLPHEVLMEKARMVCEAVNGKVVKEEW
jgi:DNA polymerase-3 subunit gamma/tau